MKKKLTVNTLALGNLRQRKKQYTVLIVSIILAMIFVSGIPFFLSCLSSSQEEMRFRRYGKQDFIYLNAHESYFSDMLNSEKTEGEIGYAEVLAYVYPISGNEEKGAYIGRLDKRASELYYQILLEGSYPQNDNEIAIEKTTLIKLGADIKIGDSITFSQKEYNEAGFSAETQEKTYILTGILADKQIYLENLHSSAYELAKLLPSVFTADTEYIEKTGSENLIGFLEEAGSPEAYRFFAFEATPENTLNTSEMYATSIGDSYYLMIQSMGTLTYLSILLALLACFAIVNAFNSNLKERKNQIGLLKAVGTTKRQILNIFGREAFIISVITAPISVIISYFGVKLIAHILGENFIFIPDISILFIGAVFGIISVMGAALIPLLKISKLSPLQAIRDIEILRKIRNKKITSQKNFSAPSLLAKRKLIFSGGKRILVSSILALTVVICSMTGSAIKISAKEAEFKQNYDYEIYDFYADNERVYEPNSYINEPIDSPITEGDRQLCFDIPQIKSVLGTKTVRANVLIDGERPIYLEVNDIYSIDTSSKYPEAREILNNLIDQMGESVKTQDKTDELIKLIHEDTSNIENPYYTEIKEKAGFTEELFDTVITAKSDALIDGLKDNVLDGEINLERLNSGEEIIIRAPEEIGFFIKPLEDNSGAIYGIVNMAYKNSPELSKDEKDSFDNVILRAKSPYKAGNKITLSILTVDENGSIKRTDRTFTIGAIIGKSQYDSEFGIITTLSGLNTFGISYPYSSLDIYLKEECDAETDEFITTKLTAMFPGKDITSVFVVNEGNKADHQTLIISLVSLVLVFGAICISLISNTVTANIRESKKTLGMLRAVGCSEKELFSSYSLQIINMLLWGTVPGIIISLIAYFILNVWIVTDTHFPLSVLPVLVFITTLTLVCFINLKSKLKTVTKHSIVENIREL